MHLRRALLLFAIVLGLAALTASLSRPREQAPVPERTPPATALAPSAPRDEEDVQFMSDGPPRTRSLPLGAAATVTVTVSAPGQVTVEGLGLVSAAEPLTPASFPVHADTIGRYPVLFTPPGDDRTRRLGTLVVS